MSVALVKARLFHPSCRECLSCDDGPFSLGEGPDQLGRPFAGQKVRVEVREAFVQQCGAAADLVGEHEGNVSRGYDNPWGKGAGRADRASATIAADCRMRSEAI